MAGRHVDPGWRTFWESDAGTILLFCLTGALLAVLIWMQL